MSKQPLTLKHPAVKAARAKWDAAQSRGQASKHNLTFEQLFDYFKVDEVRHLHIARQAGLSRERVRQIYNKYFRDIFEGSRGRERREAYAHKSRKDRAKQSIKCLLSNDKALAAITKSVHRAGGVVEFVGRDNQQSVYTNRVCANGHLCSVYKLYNSWSTPKAKREYARVTLAPSTIQTTEAVIFYSGVNGYTPLIFVVPTSTLLNAFPDLEYKRKGMVIPLKKLPSYNNQKTRIDWWQHEEAWHHLPQKSTKTASK